MTSSLLFRQDLSDADLAATNVLASEARRRDGGGPTTPFQLPFPPFVAFGSDAGEASLRNNCSLFEFLRQHQQRNQPLNYVPSLTADDGRHALERTSPVRCVICLAAFPSAWLLEQHNSLQHSIDSRNSETGSPGEDKPFKCEQCGQNYRYRSSYLKHQEQNHRPKVPGDKLFTCDVCGMQFRYLKSFKKHRLNHALEKLHTKSPNGDATVRNNGALDKHLSQTGAESLTDVGSVAAAAAAENPTRPYSLTDVTMANGSGTESGRVTAPPSTGAGNGGHGSASVESERPPANAGAERSASAPAGSAESAATRASGGPRAPDYRPAKPAAPAAIDRFSDSDEQEEAVDSLAFALADADASGSLRCRRDSPLLSLLRMNSAERNRETKFACPFCAKCVRSKENLKLHIRKHTGERPFVCLFCGRAFGGKSDLTRHLRIHTGERPYHCEMCGKCFARADYLSKHLTTHVHSHNARPFVARPTP